MCLGSAYALGMNITSPYFDLSFGPNAGNTSFTTSGPTSIIYTNPVVPDEPPVPPNTPPNNNGGSGNGNGNGNGNGGNDSGATSTCLLNLLCLDLKSNVAGLAPLNLSLGKLGQSTTDSLNGLLGLDLNLGGTPQPTSAPGQTGAGECTSAACVDLGVLQGSPASEDLLGLDVQVPPLDTGVQVGVGSQQGVQLDVTLPVVLPTSEPANLNLLNLVEVGVGGGSSGVGINLKLFP
ncbi:MAG: hypothetical protein KIT29_00815 [Anaerolineales bacterium]|nr:hypothetical protein [Anaerolineales bacterium]